MEKICGKSWAARGYWGDGPQALERGFCDTEGGVEVGRAQAPKLLRMMDFRRHSRSSIVEEVGKHHYHAEGRKMTSAIIKGEAMRVTAGNESRGSSTWSHVSMN